MSGVFAGLGPRVRREPFRDFDVSLSKFLFSIPTWTIWLGKSMTISARINS
jgi:hypothetical protein